MGKNERVVNGKKYFILYVNDLLTIKRGVLPVKNDPYKPLQTNYKTLQYKIIDDLYLEIEFTLTPDIVKIISII